MTEVLHVDPAAPDAMAIARAAERLRAGGLVAFPTETVYGLGVHALDREAVRRLFAAKGRPANDPLIVHIRSYDDVSALVPEIPPAAGVLAARFWPGPLTLIMQRAASVPDEVTAGLDTVAIRVPAHPIAQALLRAARIPIAAPSANLFSRPSPTRAAHVLEDLDGRIDMVIDGGNTSVGVESTVLDLTREVPRVLRPGAVTLAEIQETIGAAESGKGAMQDGPLRSPGLLERHYSPRAPLTLYEGATPEAVAQLRRDLAGLLSPDRRIGLLLATEDRAFIPGSDRLVIADLGSAGDLAGVAARLYAALRELDAAGVDIILARDFPADGGLGTAIHDRLRRAAAGNVVRPSGG